MCSARALQQSKALLSHGLQERLQMRANHPTERKKDAWSFLQEVGRGKISPRVAKRESPPLPGPAASPEHHGQPAGPGRTPRCRPPPPEPPGYGRTGAPAALTACCPGACCLKVVEREMGGTTAAERHCSGSCPAWMACVAKCAKGGRKPADPPRSMAALQLQLLLLLLLLLPPLISPPPPPQARPLPRP